MAAEYEVNIKINTQEIERELKKVDKAVNNIGKGKGGKKQPILALPSTEMLNATAKKIQSLDNVNRKIALRQREINKQTRDQALSIDTLVKTQEKRARLLNKINEMEAKGLNVSKLRKQLAKATTEQSNRRFGSAEKEFRILEKSIRLEQSKLRILKEQRKGFASSPVGGTRTMMGSPAQIAAAGRQIASPIRGGLNFPGSPIALAGATVSKTPFGPSFPTGGAALPVGGSTAIPGSPKAIQAAKATELRATQVQGSWSKALGQLQETAKIFESKNARVRQSWTTALSQLSETAKNISTNRTARVKQSWATALGQLEETAKDISRNNVTQRRQRRKKTFEQVGLGAGFPLLFGGGPGAVLGGAAGGLTGSFGAQIALSAAGQLVDRFVESIVNAGKAFGSLGETLDLMRERSLFTSKESEELARQLEELGNVEGLAELATIELASKIGSEGIEAFQDLETEVDEFDRLVGHLMISLQAFLAGPLGDFLEIINATLGKKVTQGTIDRLAGSLQDPADRTRFRAAAKERIGTELEIQGFGMGGLPRSAEVLKSAPLDLLSELSREVAGGKFGESNLLSRPLRVTRQDRETFKPKKDKAAEEKKRIDQRIAALQIEAAKIAEISAFKDRIAAAEAAEDTMLVIRLQGEQQLKEIESSRLDKLIGVTTQREKDAINLVAQAEKTAAIAQTEREINAEYLRRQNLFDNTVEDLEHQLALATATSEAERERLRIEKKLQELREDGLSDTQVGRVGQLMQDLATANSPLNQFIKQSIESLNNLEQHAVQVSQGIGNAIGNSLVSGMQNLITGAQSIKQVFADMLKSIADVLAKQAAQMIATYIAIGIAKAFALGGNSGGEASAPVPKTGSAFQGTLNPPGQFGSGPGFAPPSTFAPPQLGNFSVPPTKLAASGAYVSSPTRALIGEGGEPEFVIPESKMRESMARYSRGARGSSVIPEAGGSGTSGEGGGVAVAAPIDVRYSVERINSVDYVTADQFQQGIRQAADQGAKQGEQQTLKRLQMSSSTRKRLGM